MVLVLLYVHASKDGPIANFYLYTRYGVQKSQGLPTQQMNELMNTDHNACILVDDRLPFTTEGIVCRVIQATSPDRTKYKELDKEGGRYATKHYYMPIWDDGELELCRTLHEARLGVTITPESIRELVEIAGRVPRYLFGYPDICGGRQR